MRIVMPLFDFFYRDKKEFIFTGGKYSLKRFVPEDEIPEIDLFSKQDLRYMELEQWALIADVESDSSYKEDINLLLLSFKIYKLSRLFIKYRLCKENSLRNFRLAETMQYVLREKSSDPISFEDLLTVDKGFVRLLEMNGISIRTHNALYFMYVGFFTRRWIEAFLFFMNALEALFSKEEPGAATRTVCSRVSCLLESKDRCTYRDIEYLYNIRSRIVHGNIAARDDPDENLINLHNLEYLLTECMKKILDEKIYLLYSDIDEKESFYDDLVARIR